MTLERGEAGNGLPVDLEGRHPIGDALLRVREHVKD
jgi:hypothetical protein